MSKTFKDVPAFRRERRIKDHRPMERGGHKNLLRDWVEEEREETLVEEAQEETQE
jgi:hypothetical protein